MKRQPEPAAVRFVIDQVTLHGFSPAQRSRFLDALEKQLRTLGESGQVGPGTGRQRVVDHVAAAVRTAMGSGR